MRARSRSPLLWSWRQASGAHRHCLSCRAGRCGHGNCSTVEHTKPCSAVKRRLYDSDKMIPYFEEKFPQKKLGRPDELPSVCVALPCNTNSFDFCLSALRC